MGLSLGPRLSLLTAMTLLGLSGVAGGTSGGSAPFSQFDPRKVFPSPPVWGDKDPDAKEDEGADDADEAPEGTFRATGSTPTSGPGGAALRGEGEGEGEGEGVAADPGAGRPKARRLPDFSGVQGKPVVVIPIEGTIDLGLAPFIARVVEESAQRGAAAVVLDINTFGGRVDAAVRIKDALLGSAIPTVAFINRRAISAGALIALACDVIAVASGATMGAATPVQMGGGGQAKPVAEKMVSYMRKEMRSTAEAKGRDGDIAEAMVDADRALKGLAPEGKLLTLTTMEGLRHGMFDLEAETFEGLRGRLGLADNPVDTAAVNWAERIARVLTDPTLSGLLMTVGMLGLLMELYTAGFGVTGFIGLFCLFLFFLGHVVADLAGLEEVLLFFAGLALIVAEGLGLGGGTGLLAAGGISALVVSLVMALIEAPIEVSWETGDIASALTRVAVALGATLGGGLVLSKLFPRTGLFHRMVLQAQLDGAHAHAPDVPTDTDVEHTLVGARGRSTTDLRPFGKARIGGRKLEVTTEGGFLAADVPVRVVRIEGRNVVVREVEEDEPGEGP